MKGWRAEARFERLSQLIVGTFLNALSAEEAAGLSPWWLETPEGAEAFRESWPKIVDAYFAAVCNPKPKRRPENDRHAGGRRTVLLHSQFDALTPGISAAGAGPVSLNFPPI